MATIQGEPLIAGSAHGEALFTNEPLSFWGGYNAREGKIIDTHHELCGASAAGKVLVLPGARGSSTGSGILLEAIRLGSAPAAMILKQRDAILGLGAIVGRELYQKVLPLVVVTDQDFELLHKATQIKVDESGLIEFDQTGFLRSAIP
jgi:predicted aconitase with swiveling domain